MYIDINVKWWCQNKLMQSRALNGGIFFGKRNPGWIYLTTKRYLDHSVPSEIQGYVFPLEIELISTDFVSNCFGSTMTPSISMNIGFLWSKMHLKACLRQFQCISNYKKPMYIDINDGAKTKKGYKVGPKRRHFFREAHPSVNLPKNEKIQMYGINWLCWRV